MYTLGSSVEIRTKHRSIYLYGKDEYEYTTIRGTVIKTPSYIDYPAVGLKTDDSFLPLSIIALSIIDGYVEEEVPGISKAYTIQSKNSTYLVTVVNGKVQCSCTGFQYHRRCKHSDPFKEQK